MSRTIVVPLDTNPASEVSLPVAEALARRIDGKLCLLSVVEAPAELAVWLQAQKTIDAWVERHLTVDAYLTGISERFPDLPVETSVTTGHPSPEIVGFAGQQSNPVIVMASNARTGLDRLTIGNVASSVLHSARCPVVVVRAGEDASGPAAAGPLDRIVVALDGSEFAERALAAVQQVLGPEGLSIHLVRVVETTKWFGSTVFDIDYGALELYIQAAYEETNEYLETMAGELEAAGHTVSWQAADGLVADEIAGAATAFNAGLVVMATHGRTGPGRVLLGSVAERVVRESDRPVFLINPGAGGDG